MPLSLLARARQLVSRPGETPAGETAAPPPGDAYRDAWNSNARGDAITAILTPTDGANSEAEFDRAGRLDAEWLRNWIAPDAVVLDVGCGIGRIEKHLAPYCARICSVDVSDEMIAKARAWTAGRDNVEFHRGSSTDLSMFPDASFDFVFSYFVLQHTDHEDALLALCEIARVLKPGARAMIQFPNFDSAIYGAGFVHQAVTHDKRPVRVRMYTRDFVRRMVDLAGLRVDRFEEIPHGEFRGTLNENEIVAFLARPVA
ncbi:MAG TPA: class I SAM-dependent methyltransferase [Chloroflexota bacterium]|nr:class I SAM-dependent methyltransferase [Chloroflexota bacterium]